MGQAKNRGSFRERQAAAIARDYEERKRKELERLDRYARMTPEERAADRAAKQKVGLLAAFVAAAAPRVLDGLSLMPPRH